MIKGKTVLVTGASSGIGQAIAVACAKQEAVVLINYRNNLVGAKETLEQVKKYSKGEIFQADLSKNDEVEKMFGEINNKGYKVLHGLVNNAGEYADGGFDDLDVWEDQFRNIFMSQVYVSNAFIKNGKSKNLRKIVNISSVYGISEMGNPDAPQYSAAKAAVGSFTMNLAKRYGPNILVNAIAPGYVWTPPWEQTSKEELKACEDLTKIGRFIKSEEIANMAIELLNNDAITGEKNVLMADFTLCALDKRTAKNFLGGFCHFERGSLKNHGFFAFLYLGSAISHFLKLFVNNLLTLGVRTSSFFMGDHRPSVVFFIFPLTRKDTDFTATNTN